MSKYDNYYDRKSSKGKAACLQCGKIIIVSGRSTYGMKKHLETHDVFLNEDQEEPPTTMTSKAPKRTMLDRFLKRESLEEMISREAAQLGATFRYLAKSILIREGLKSKGYQDKAPRSHPTVKRMVHKSAEDHREIVRGKLQKLLAKGERFCIITDEWTCTSKRRRYMDVTLHIKGTNYFLHFIYYLLHNVQQIIYYKFSFFRP